MNPLRPTSSPEPAATEPLALARPLALLIGAAVVAWAGIGWGPPGTLAAGIGVVISLANVWVLERLGARAVREVAEPDAATATKAAVRLQAALAGKTIVLLALVALAAKVGLTGATLTPFTLGLLVSVFALLAAGLLAPWLDRGRQASSQP